MEFPHILIYFENLSEFFLPCPSFETGKRFGVLIGPKVRQLHIYFKQCGIPVFFSVLVDLDRWPSLSNRSDSIRGEHQLS